MRIKAKLQNTKEYKINVETENKFLHVNVRVPLPRFLHILEIEYKKKM